MSFSPSSSTLAIATPIVRGPSSNSARAAVRSRGSLIVAASIAFAWSFSASLRPALYSVNLSSFVRSLSSWLFSVLSRTSFFRKIEFLLPGTPRWVPVATEVKVRNKPLLRPLNVLFLKNSAIFSILVLFSIFCKNVSFFLSSNNS